MTPNTSRWLRTLGALTPPVLSVTALALVGLVAVRALVPAETLRPSNGEVGNYLQTLGSIYAVLLAFVVFVVWNQFNETRGHIEAEANELVDLFRTSKGFHPEMRRPIQHQLRAYVEEVLRREWPAMTKCVELAEEPGGPLDRLWDLLLRFEPASQCHCALYDQMLERFNDLSDVRARRLLSSRTRIPLALRILLYLGALMTVGSTYLFAIDHMAVHAIVTGALAGAVAHVLYIIHDLDQCFSGDWQVSKAPYERVRHLFEQPEEATEKPTPIATAPAHQSSAT
jgi:hypothetical protein